ncbi:MAG TPA: sodium/solute symporter [Tepidisphaeraceae bacterium]|nr:sodium/solute symporter [Tepidisphaeraceae bacterium]
MADGNTNFTWIDVVIILGYLALLVSIGVYFSRRQKGIESFFLAGRRMGWLPIGLSLMAALNSGIDYVAGPSTIFKFGLIFTAGVLSWVFLYPWVAYVSLPFYRRLQTVSAYEYLERRFNVGVRTLAACIFLLWRIGWMGTAMYVPALAIEAITGGRIRTVPLIIVIGTVVTIYTMLGGIQAVIWTDVIQFCIMLTGVAVAIGVILYNLDGGVTAVWSLAAAEGKTSFSFNLNIPDNASPWDRVRLYFAEPRAMSAIVIAAVVGRMAGYTSDQVMVQRFQTTKSLKDSRQAFIINAVGDAVWTLGLAFVGLALFAYFQTHALPEQFRENTDKVFPYFMANVFPTGVIGLVVAAVLAASLSSIDSGINSCTSVVVVDFYNRLFLGRQVNASGMGVASASDTEVCANPAALDSPRPDSAADQREQLLVSRIANLCFGLLGIIIASNVGRLGIVLEIGAKVIQTFTGPILAIYLLGMFSRRARSYGVIVGGVLGTGVALYIAFVDTGITFVWPTVFGFVTTIVVGYAASLPLPRPEGEQGLELTWRRVMRKPLPDDVAEARDPGGRGLTDPAPFAPTVPHSH